MQKKATYTLHCGFTMIELLIAITILGILISLGLPAALTMIQNAQIRSQAESVLSGLQFARAEAVKRNTQVRFQLMNDLSSACAPNLSGKAWVVSQFDATNLCNISTDNTTAVTDAGFSSATNPLIFKKKDGSEGGQNSTVAATSTDPAFTGVVVFNGLGQVVTPTQKVQINIDNPTGGTCVASGGNMRCLQIQVLLGGQTRMCDPSVGSTDIRYCP